MDPTLIGQWALEGLRRELELDPKPGLVTPFSQGSHGDMHEGHFRASLGALQDYFSDCGRLGAAGCDFAALQSRGIAAERAMLAATGGVNTHKGAIFTLGLLCAAAGGQAAATMSPGSPAGPHINSYAAAPRENGGLGAAVVERWGHQIAAARAGSEESHGGRVRRQLGLPDARDHALAGFPVLFGTTWPALEFALGRGVGRRAALCHSLLATLGVLADTNLAHRGGLAGLVWAQDAALDFLEQGSVFHGAWLPRLQALGKAFEARRLSPGGSADLLAAAWFLHRLSAYYPEAGAPSRHAGELSPSRLGVLA